MGSLQGKVALVTGASAGIGRAIAFAAAREGASLVLGDVAEAGGKSVVAELKARGADACFLRTDIRNRADIDELLAFAIEKFGVPDVVFANAGVEGSISAPWETSEADFTWVIDTNVTGTWRTIAAVLPGMVKRGSGAIVTTASVAGLVGAGGLAAYVASKHAVVGLTKSVAIDVAKSGIRVNAICPGMIDTAMVDRLQEAVPTFRETLMVFKPMGRLGNPEEVAEAAIWLASPAASFITGHTLAIDGGYVAQ